MTCQAVEVYAVKATGGDFFRRRSNKVHKEKPNQKGKVQET